MEEKIKTMVEQTLETDERARNDDKWLVYLVYRKLTKIFIPFEDFEKTIIFISLISLVGVAEIFNYFKIPDNLSFIIIFISFV